MTQPTTSAPRRLVAVGRYEAGQPVYTVCDPDPLTTGAMAAGMAQAAAGHMPVRRSITTHNRPAFHRPIFACIDLGDGVLHVRRAGERP